MPSPTPVRNDFEATSSNVFAYTVNVHFLLFLQQTQLVSIQRLQHSLDALPLNARLQFIIAFLLQLLQLAPEL